jgi:AcrR family transcriptional regulator
MMSVAGTTNPQKRILRAATDLFAAVGFSGASTRDIARMAAVNDATVYRHFSSKRDLFAAVIETELQKLHDRADLLLRVVNTDDVRSAPLVIFDLLTEALVGQPRLVRLLQFSVLEFGCTLQPLYDKYLRDLFDNTIEYLDSSRPLDPRVCGDSRAMVAVCAATVVGLQTLHPFLGGEQIPILPVGG